MYFHTPQSVSMYDVWCIPECTNFSVNEQAHINLCQVIISHSSIEMKVLLYLWRLFSFTKLRSPLFVVHSQHWTLYEWILLLGIMNTGYFLWKIHWFRFDFRIEYRKVIGILFVIFECVFENRFHKYEIQWIDIQSELLTRLIQFFRTFQQANRILKMIYKGDARNLFNQTTKRINRIQNGIYSKLSLCSNFCLVYHCQYGEWRIIYICLYVHNSIRTVFLKPH